MGKELILMFIKEMVQKMLIQMMQILLMDQLRMKMMLQSIKIHSWMMDKMSKNWISKLKLIKKRELPVMDKHALLHLILRTLHQICQRPMLNLRKPKKQSHYQNQLHHHLNNNKESCMHRNTQQDLLTVNRLLNLILIVKPLVTTQIDGPAQEVLKLVK